MAKTITIHSAKTGAEVIVETDGTYTANEAQFKMSVPSIDYSARFLASEIGDGQFKARKAIVIVEDDEWDAFQEFAEAHIAACAPSENDKLRKERKDLVLKFRSLLDAQESARNRAWENHDGDAAFKTAAKYDDRIEAAEKALAQFDAEHPEIKQQIEQEREEKRQENIKRGQWR